MTGNPPKRNITSRAVKCPDCGGSIKIEAAGRTVSLGCRFCGGILDVTGEDAVLIESYQRLMTGRPEPIVPLGSKWKFEGIEWKFVGFVQKSDQTGIYSWREYILVHPMHGQSWLVEFNNHWIHLKRLRSMPNAYGDGFRGPDKRHYRTFQRGQAKVLYVVGEFPWRVRYGDQTETLDAVAPPFILSMERDASEISWTAGKYIDPETVKAGFGKLLKGIRSVLGIHPAQPNPHTKRASAQLTVSALASAAMAVLALQAGALESRELRLSQQFEFESGRETPVEILSEPFEITRKAFVFSHIHADLDNSWLEAEVELLPVRNPAESTSPEADATDERDPIEYTQGLEYYHGVDGGESWTEGSQKDSGQLGGVPPGWWRAKINLLGKSDRLFIARRMPDYRYIDGKLVDLNAEKPQPTGPEMRGSFRLVQASFLSSQFIYFLGLLWFWPLLTYIRKSNFEKRRWEEAS